MCRERCLVKTLHLLQDLLHCLLSLHPPTENMAELKYIITADDFGACSLIDQAIEDLIGLGIVTSVAAFANIEHEEKGFSPERAVALKQRFPHVSMGLHFTINSGGNVHPERTALNRGRNFFKPGNHKKFRYFKQQPHDEASEDDIVTELQAQIKAFESAGLEIEHFTAHGPPLTHTKKGFSALLKVVDAYNQERARANMPPVPIRNPMFIGTLISDNKNNLDSSFFSNFFAKGFTGLSNVFKHDDRKILISQEHLLDSIGKLNDHNIPMTTFFVESLYNSAHVEILEDIFDARNFDGLLNVCPPEYSVRNPITTAFNTAEIVVHLAYGQVSGGFSGKAYRKKLNEAKRYGGIEEGYLRINRPAEREALEHFFEKHPHERRQLVNFKGERIDRLA